MPPERRSARALPSLLDRLMDPQPDQAGDGQPTPSETVSDLRKAVQRDVEALLNARRPWRSVPDGYPALRLSPLGYGISDFTAGAFNDPKQQEILRQEIEAAIRRFEPRLSRIHVQIAEDPAPLRATLVLRIHAQLRIHPVPEPISFDTMIDTTTADVVLRPLQES
jgi:type VI secretion system protein ImpF